MNSARPSGRPGVAWWGGLVAPVKEQFCETFRVFIGRSRTFLSCITMAHHGAVLASSQELGEENCNSLDNNKTIE